IHASDGQDRLPRGHFQPLAAGSQDAAFLRCRQLVEGNQSGARHLRILPRGGRPMDARSARQGNRGQSVRRAQLAFDGGQFTDSGPPGRRGKFTVEKRNKQTNTEIMNQETQAIRNDMGQLAEDAQALMAATADVAGEKVVAARKRLAAALESAKEIAANVREKAIAGAQVADQTVRENPYQAIAVGVGVGAVVGYLLARRCSRSCD